MKVWLGVEGGGTAACGRGRQLRRTDASESSKSKLRSSIHEDSALVDCCSGVLLGHECYQLANGAQSRPAHSNDNGPDGVRAFKLRNRVLLSRSTESSLSIQFRQAD